LTIATICPDQRFAAGLLEVFAKCHCDQAHEKIALMPLPKGKVLVELLLDKVQASRRGWGGGGSLLKFM
jgi:hypothetical protein